MRLFFRGGRATRARRNAWTCTTIRSSTASTVPSNGAVAGSATTGLTSKSQCWSAIISAPPCCWRRRWGWCFNLSWVSS